MTRLTRQLMCLRAVRELEEGMYVNLGLGIPSVLPYFIPPDLDVIFHIENGALNIGPIPDDWDNWNIDLVNAGGQPISLKPGISFFSTVDAFAMIAGGHIDVTILGAYQVSERGDLANWKTNEQAKGAIGGSMDLATGAKRVIVIMEHIDTRGRPKIVKECSYPLTGKGVVSLVVTDMAVLGFVPEGIELREVAPGLTPEEIQSFTEPKLIISKELREMEF